MLKSDVLVHFNGKVNSVAKALGISQPSVSGWGERVPELRASQLDRITSGALKYNPENYQRDVQHAA